MRPRKLTPFKKKEFVALIRGGFSVAAASARIGLSRQALYDEKDRDVHFRTAWDAAEQEGVDVLVDEIRTRALDREDRDSARLLMFLVKGLRPQFKENYRDKPIQVEHVREVTFSKKDMDEAMDILSRARDTADAKVVEPTE